MIKRLICILLVLSMALSLCACGKEPMAHEDILEEPETSEAVVEVAAAEKSVEVADASAMKLVKTVGGVHVRDDSDAELPVFANMNLYSGYHMGTGTKSYAWINLDDTKLLKMDELSNADLEKSGRKLKVTLSAGKIFFCVLDSLEEDEALIFETPNATNSVLAVRGTTGFIEVVSDHEVRIVLLEGRIEGTAVYGSFALETGKLTDIIVPCKKSGHNVREEDSGIDIRDIDYEKDIPWFVIDEIQNNPDVKDKLEENGGFTDYPEGTTDEPVDETTHEYSYRQEFVAPTCIDEGYTLHTCICGFHYKDNFVAPLGHQWGQWKIIRKPTESIAGLEERICSRCDEVETRNAKLDPYHTHSYEEKVIPANCTDEGYTSYTCSCGNTYKDNYVNPLGHKWNDWVTTKEPTETEEGIAERTCNQCGSAETKNLPKRIPGHSHNYVGIVVKEPTCTAEGTMNYSCDCGDMYSQSIDKVDHNFEETERVESTCLKDGHILYTCTMCAETTISTIAASGHNWGEWVTVQEPTETTEGLAERTCDKCGEKETQTLPLTHQHSYTAGRYSVSPTCTSKGLEIAFCSCGDSTTTVRYPSSHQYEVYEKVQRTCTEGGYDLATCIYCGSTRRNEYSVGGHIPGGWQVVQRPTETSPGLSSRGCERCGYEVTREVPPLIPGHTHNFSVEITQRSSCIAYETSIYTCDCGYSYTQTEQMSGHNFGGKQVVEPTCTQDGTVIETCSVCDTITQTATIPASHDWGSWEVIQAPTEDTAGVVEFTCSLCGAKETKSCEPIA